MKTIFQKIIDREIPSTIIWEDDEIIAINDIAPIAPIHILIIPKKPIPTIIDAQTEDTNLIGKMVMTAQKIAKEKNIEGYKLLFNVGEKGGQTVFHVHMHLLAGDFINIESLH